MRIAVTHQKPRYEYDMFREKPDLPFLRQMLEPTMEDCYAMLEQAGKGGADLIACPTWGWENIYGLSRAYENSVTIAAAMGIHAAGLPDYCDPSCIVDNMGKIVAVSPYRDQNYLVMGEVDIKKGPAPQYGSNYFYPSDSMRKTRFSQRKPGSYRLIHRPLQETPLYQRYFGTKDESNK